MKYPTTIEEAVKLLKEKTPPEQLELFSKTPKSELIQFHHTGGQWIRNYFGLWKGNEQLMKSTGKTHADDASFVIIEALWESVQ